MTRSLRLAALAAPEAGPRGARFRRKGLPTEALVAHLHDRGIDTGIDEVALSPRQPVDASLGS